MPRTLAAAMAFAAMKEGGGVALGEGGAVFGCAPDGADDVVAVEDAEHGIDARGPLEHFGAVTLDEASGDNDAFELAGVFALDGVFDDGEGFFFGGFEEAAGVDDDGVCAGEVARGSGCFVLVGVGEVGGVIRGKGDGGDAVFGEHAEHFFGVHEVLRAPEGDEGDGFNGFVGGGRHRGQCRGESGGVEVLFPDDPEDWFGEDG